MRTLEVTGIVKVRLSREICGNTGDVKLGNRNTNVNNKEKWLSPPNNMRKSVNKYIQIIY
jgi:hypothetical protein